VDKLNKLSLPVTILIASIILGGFYYASEVTKQASIEKQQQVELQAKAESDQAKITQDQTDKEAQAEADQAKAVQAQAQQQAVIEQNKKIASEKATCAYDAQESAIKLYQNSYFCTVKHLSDCGDGITYLKNDYENAYSTCLDINGLK
jgi:uncharacterized protein (UPF0333 family)